jgi:hypothetical protein
MQHMKVRRLDAEVDAYEWMFDGVHLNNPKQTISKFAVVTS